MGAGDICLAARRQRCKMFGFVYTKHLNGLTSFGTLALAGVRQRCKMCGAVCAIPIESCQIVNAVYMRNGVVMRDINIRARALAQLPNIENAIKRGNWHKVWEEINYLMGIIPKGLTPSEIKDIIAYSLAGHTIAQIAKHYGVSRPTIYKVVGPNRLPVEKRWKNRGTEQYYFKPILVPVAPPPPKQEPPPVKEIPCLTDERIKEMLDMTQLNISPEEIGHINDCARCKKRFKELEQ